MLIALSALVLAPPALAAPPHQPPWPTFHEDGPALRAAWTAEGEALRSPVRAFEGGGVRVGAIAVSPEPLRMEARGVDGAAAGPWVEAAQLWTNGMERVLVAELGEAWPAAQVRVRGHEALRDIAWELRHPVDEPRLPEGVEPPPSVSGPQAAIGVVSREQWGAQATRCTSTEDDWTRMAIHHTAGNQLSGGTVQGAVQALQAYAMGGSTYCDIPYQFLVGYDGSLWEGRPLTYTSGATGGGNNDGNIAVCFLGCYHPTSCPTSHEVTEAMMDWAGLLTRTLSEEHGIPLTTDAVRGHRDWPDNATACPGDWVHARLDELRQPLPPYAAGLVALDLPTDGEGRVVLERGEEVEGALVLRNEGHLAWDASTRLAPSPRDVASPLAAPGWLSATRVSAPEAGVAPGAQGRFPLSLAPEATGSFTLTLTLVQEGVSWFADLPLGGETPDDAFVLEILVVEPSDSPEPSPDDSAVEDAGLAPGVPRSLSGPGCAAVPGGGGAWLLALIGLGLRRLRSS